MSDTFPWVVKGAAVGIGAMLWLRFSPLRLRRLGPLVAVVGGALLALGEWSFRDPNFRGHDFETAPEYYFVPAIVATLLVYVAVTNLQGRAKSDWVGAAVAIVTGATLHHVLRVLVWFAMLMICCA